MSTLEAPKKNTVDKLFKDSLKIMLLSELLIACVNPIGSLFVGRFLGADPLAALGVLLPVITLSHSFASIICNGLQSLCAEKIGLVKTREANGAFMMGMVLTFIIACAYSLICLFAPDFILNLFGADKCTPEVALLAKSIYQAVFMALFPLCFP